MTLEAAAAAKHVLCEKPLARNIAECDQMIAACEQARVNLGVIFQFRFEPLALKLKALVESGKLGSLIWNSANTIWYRTPEYYASAPWRRTWDGGGGGVLINQAIHMIDLMLWLSGMPKRITAQTRTLRHAIETEDAALATLEYDGGHLGLVQATTAAYPGYPERLEIYGTKGGAVYHKGQGKLEWHLADPKEDGLEEAAVNSGAATHLSTNINSHSAQFQDFAQAIRESRPPLVDGHEGRKSIEVIEAIYRSARENKSILLSTS
jgi:predicted dehydrogenase